MVPYMYSEMQNKKSKTRDSPLESMGQIISSRCPSISNGFVSSQIYDKCDDFILVVLDVKKFKLYFII